jgi:hypothetical protein
MPVVLPTTWTRLPFSAGASLFLEFEAVWELYAAAMERENVFGRWFPPPAMVLGGLWTAAGVEGDGGGMLTAVTVENVPVIGRRPPPDPNPPAVALTPGQFAPLMFDGDAIYLDIVIEPDLDPRHVVRSRVNGNTADRITFEPAAAPEGVSLAGARVVLVRRLALPELGAWWTDRSPHLPADGEDLASWTEGLRWYDAQVQQSRLSNDGTGEPSSTGFPKPSTVWTYNDGSEVSKPLFDYDLRVPIDLDADTLADPRQRDRMYCTPLFKTLRGLQLWVEWTCGRYVPVDDYDGQPGIPTFTFATLCRKAGIGWTATGTVGNDGTVSVSAPEGAREVHWTLLDRDGTPQTGGRETPHSGGVTLHLSPFVSAGSYPCEPPNPGDAGKTVVFAAGWTRELDREVRYVYAADWFLPEDTSSPADPDPADDGTAGRWYHRPASTHTLEYADQGDVGAGPELQDGWWCRYAGDRINESVDGMQPSVPDAASVVKKGDWPLTLEQKATMRGVVAGGGRGWLDSGRRDWWWWGTACTHEAGPTLTVTSTSVTDPAKAGSAFWDAATGRWAGFVVEILQPGVAGGLPGTLDGRRSEIVSSVSAAGSITFRPVAGLSGTYTSAPDGAGTGGEGQTSYRIREPRHRKSWWQGRRLYLTDPDGHERVVTVTASDDGFLFWDRAEEAEPGPGWSWRIESFEPGQTLLRTEGGWDYVPGDDDPRAVLPDRVTRYGRARKWDNVTPGLYNELYRAFCEMVWTKGAVTWRATPTKEPGSDVPNVYSAGEPMPLSPGYTSGGWGGVPASTADFGPPNQKTNTEFQWDTLIGIILPLGPEDGPPQASSTTHYNKAGDNLNGSYYSGSGLYRRFSWAWIDGIPNGLPGRRIACTAEAYAYATFLDSYTGTVNCSDPDPVNGVYHIDNQYTFDNFGDAPLEKNVFKLIGSAGGLDEDRLIVKVGSDAKPAWCDDSAPATPAVAAPAWEDNTTRRGRGYTVVKSEAILKHSLGFALI